MAKPGKQKPHRGLRFTDRKFRPHATALGQLIFTWNDLHEQLAIIYWTLSGYNDAAIDEWSKPKVDVQKRKLIRKWINALSPAHRAMAAQMYEDIIWLLEELDHLTDYRNDAAHAPLTFEPESFLTSLKDHTAGVVSNTVWKNQRAMNLARKNVLAEFRRQRDITMKLRDYALNIERALSDEHTPWPKRPPRLASKPLPRVEEG
jgi:hypothetical protein